MVETLTRCRWVIQLQDIQTQGLGGVHQPPVRFLLSSERYGLSADSSKEEVAIEFRHTEPKLNGVLHESHPRQLTDLSTATSIWFSSLGTI